MIVFYIFDCQKLFPSHSGIPVALGEALAGLAHKICFFKLNFIIIIIVIKICSWHNYTENDLYKFRNGEVLVCPAEVDVLVFHLIT